MKGEYCYEKYNRNTLELNVWPNYLKAKLRMSTGFSHRANMSKNYFINNGLHSEGPRRFFLDRASEFP
jgi:hypothetical protein